MEPRQRKALGSALATLRKARGLTQQEVAARADYSDSGTYGRIERGERGPERDKLIAILIGGLELIDAVEINRILHLAGYDGLKAEELSGMGEVPSLPVEQHAAEAEVTNPIAQHSDFRRTLVCTLIVLGSILLTTPALVVASEHSGFLLLTSFLYAALYTVSLCLETVLERNRGRCDVAGALLFGFMAFTSAGAFILNAVLINRSTRLALWAPLAVFCSAALVQFLAARSFLPDYPLVQANFQPLTAQAAHLKNTCYFLLIPILFWLPPFNCVLTLIREIRAGDADWVQQVRHHDLIVGRGVLAFSPRLLLGLLLGIIVGSLKMGARLLDNLRPSQQLNAYTTLFYLRAILYFSLAFICLGWYAQSLAEIP